MRDHKKVGAALSVSALLLSTAAAGAANSSQGFALDRYDPAERGGSWFMVDSLDFRSEPIRPSAGLTLDYGYKPLVIYNTDGSERSALVAHQLIGHVGGDVAFLGRFRLGLNLPVALFQSGKSGSLNSISYTAASGAALGDVRVGGDVRIWGEAREPFTVAAGVSVYAPTGKQSQYVSDGHIRVAPHAAVAGKVAQFVYAGKLAVEYRNGASTIDSSPTGTELQFAGSAGSEFLDEQLTFGLEFSGGTVLVNGGAFQKTTTPFELMLGAHYQLGPDFKLGFGAGTGLGRAFGTPLVRGLGSFEWAPAFAPPAPTDRDGDGVNDKDDACPDVKGVASADPRKNGCPAPDRDKDGIADAQDACPDVKGVASADPKKNGCPADTDGDGIIDEDDACPTEPGVKTKDPHTNGCPPDKDGDGIADAVDACPDVKGIKSADPKKNGCPPPPADRDHDGVPDAIDQCPDEPGLADFGGCPDKDTDGDGIVDRFDACPAEKGPKDNQGCPAKQKQLVVIFKAKLQLRERVAFDAGKGTLQKKSNTLLDQVAKVLLTHPNIAKVVIEGHTDAAGDPARNKQLSLEQAQAVKAALVARGVPDARLDVAGFGGERPLDESDGFPGNRRVELRIVVPQ
jgi:outer membrane protein OmpA-like peptidoglycan-associated protein